ncbi:LysR family transcriptional regulator [Paenibacillus senegalensis]|uniref:LysR family transcriptional regulator n=1 Tax=Paenibacillus senegalensis TaxID=1465766 RepID=UPI00028A2C81|nr:LysR family transcriptional regulator [Paenibacillus senegalensis]
MKVENLEWYKVFYTVAHSGSLSRAAEEMYITQPAVSYIVKQLEDHLAVRLFFRTAKGVTLTAEGEALYAYIEKALHLVDAGEKHVDRMKNLETGEIIIGASDMLCKHYLLPHLELFHRRYPEVSLRVTNRTSLESVELLKQGKVDFAVVHLPLNDEKGLIVYEGESLQDSFVAGASYKHLAENGALELRELLSYPLLLLEQGSNSRRFVDEFAGNEGVTLVPEIELGSHDLLVQFARIGLGIAYVVKDFVQDELNSGELYEIKLKPQLPARRIGIVSLAGVPLSAAAKQFVELLWQEKEKI